MKTQTFKGIYESIDNTAPRALWIRKIAKATMTSEYTVYNWLSGRQKPLPLTQSVIAKTLGVPMDGLFPETDK